MNKILFALPLLLSLLAFPACSTAPSPAPDGIDEIVVLYSPSGNMDADDLQRVVITDAATIAKWVAALEAVPDKPARGIRYISFRDVPSQHSVELRQNGQVQRTERMRGGHLDVSSHEGWAFYSGEDRAFADLVNAAVPGK